MSSPPSAEDSSSNWENRDYVDDFDGLIKVSGVRVEDTGVIIRERLGEKEVFIATGTYVCSDSNGEVHVDFIVDGERLDKETLSVSQSGEALFFADRAVPTWIRRLSEGKSLKLRFTDDGGETTTLAFDISGSTRFEE